MHAYKSEFKGFAKSPKAKIVIDASKPERCSCPTANENERPADRCGARHSCRFSVRTDECAHFNSHAPEIWTLKRAKARAPVAHQLHRSGLGPFERCVRDLRDLRDLRLSRVVFLTAHFSFRLSPSSTRPKLRS